MLKHKNSFACLGETVFICYIKPDKLFVVVFGNDIFEQAFYVFA